MDIKNEQKARDEVIRKRVAKQKMELDLRTLVSQLSFKQDELNRLKIQKHTLESESAQKKSQQRKEISDFENDKRTLEKIEKEISILEQEKIKIKQKFNKDKDDVKNNSDLEFQLTTKIKNMEDSINKFEQEIKNMEIKVSELKKQIIKNDL